MAKCLTVYVWNMLKLEHWGNKLIMTPDFNGNLL